MVCALIYKILSSGHSKHCSLEPVKTHSAPDVLTRNEMHKFRDVVKQTAALC